AGPRTQPPPRRDRAPRRAGPTQPLALAAAESSIRMKNHRALLVVATPTSRTLGRLFDVTASADRQQRHWELHLARVVDSTGSVARFEFAPAAGAVVGDDLL